ncbi:MAG: hypothetical protein ACREP9_04335, partial [Candidatus Dormibacteraceae bacterium]
MKGSFLLGWCCAAILLCSPVLVGAQTPPNLPKPYRMNQLDEAKKQAVATGKPIAWIASVPEY